MPKEYKFIIRRMNGDYLGEFVINGDKIETGERKVLPHEVTEELERLAIEFGTRQGYEVALKENCKRKNET